MLLFGLGLSIWSDRVFSKK